MSGATDDNDDGRQRQYVHIDLVYNHFRCRHNNGFVVD